VARQAGSSDTDATAGNGRWGSVHCATSSLADAREVAAGHRRTLALEGDPLRDRRARRAANLMTFDKATELCIADRKAGWRNRKHGDQWLNTLRTYASPIIGNFAVADVTADHVVQILRPIWTTKPATASRLRGRIELVLDWAKVHGHRTGENAAAWRSNLALVFPPISKVRPTTHHAAVEIDKMPQAFARLGELGTVAALAARFCIAVAARPGEVRAAKWAHIDLETRTWTVPVTKQGQPASRCTEPARPRAARRSQEAAL